MLNKRHRRLAPSRALRKRRKLKGLRRYFIAFSYFLPRIQPFSPVVGSWKLTDKNSCGAEDTRLRISFSEILSRNNTFEFDLDIFDIISFLLEFIFGFR